MRTLESKSPWGRRRPISSSLLLAAAASVCLLAGWLVAHPVGLRLAVAGAALALVAGLGAIEPRSLLYGLVIWLAALGLVRRLIAASSQAATLDPLLLVAPVALAVLAVVAAERGAFRGLSRLSKAVAVLTVLAVVGSINPLQGGLATGAGGLFFMVVPLLAFWVGRGLCGDRMLGRLLKLVGGLAVGAAAYGLVQTFSRFPSWDQAWIRTAGFAALHVRGVIRPFGTFSSSAEYAYFLAIALVVWLGFGLRRGRFPLTLGAVGLLGVGILYQGSRGILVLLMVALGMAASARLRVPVVAGGLVAILFLAGLQGVASLVGGATFGTGPASALVEHQIQGLANPLDPTSSTLGLHLSMFGEGLRSAFTHPVGRGTGAVSLAAQKFGGVAAGTEIDLSNVGVALGIPGVLAYLAVLVMGLSKAYRLAATRKDALPRVALCVLVVMLLQWLNGGMYAVAFLPWLVLGWVDRSAPGEPTGAASAAGPA